MADAPLQLPEHRQGRRILRRCRTIAIAIFVVWHVSFLLFRNAIRQFDSDRIAAVLDTSAAGRAVLPAYRSIDRATAVYEGALGLDQGWLMFTSPLATSCPFAVVRLEFADGSSELIASETEPRDPARFFWRGGVWRLRKLEHALITRDDWLDTFRRPIYEAWLRWRIDRWRAEHPADPRKLSSVTLLSRTIRFPRPEADPAEFAEGTLEEIARFNPDGSAP